MIHKKPQPSKLFVAALKVALYFIGLVPAIGVEIARAQDPSPSDGIWEPPVLSQPFDVEPFRPIRIPSWVEKTLGCGYTLSVMGPEQRQQAVAHGVSISEMGFVDPFYAYYDSKLLKRRSPHVPSDRLKKDVSEYERLGLRILGVYPPCLQAEVYETHPDWRRIATNTTEIPTIDLQQFPHGGMLCLLGPYGDFMISVLEEILTQFPEVDAFSFDGLHYGGVCYCEHCRRAYREASGAEIPNANLDDLAFRKYQHWADRKMENLVQRMQERLKAIQPEVALITWSTNAGRFGHFLSIPRNMPSRMNLLLDAPDQEFWMDETNRGASIVPAVANAYIWATTNHRVAFSEPYLLSHGNPYGKDSFPAHEIERRMMLACTYGALPSIAVLQPDSLQQSLFEIMDHVQAIRPWLIQKSPEPWAAMLLSDNTRNFYGRQAGFVEERYMSSVFGAFRAGVEAHLPFHLINDWNLTPEELAKHAVIVLPNAASLDDRQIDALQKYVVGGGGLVASLDTSLFDEFGSPRDNFGLSKLLGVDFHGMVSTQGEASREIDINFAKSMGADYWEKRKNVFELRIRPDSIFQTPTFRKYVGVEPVTLKGPAIAVRPQEEASIQVHGSIRAKGMAGAVDYPAIVTREYGAGRVVYFAAGVDAAYYSYSYPYQRLLIQQAILWAANREPPVQVDAPMCVHATLMQQTIEAGNDSSRKQWILQLFNDINTTAHHAFPNDDVPLREETIPISNIEVRVRKNEGVSRVILQPQKEVIPVQFTENGARFVLPKLDVHQLVVIELEGGP